MMNRYRLLENLHLPFWLVKDFCWAMVWRPLGIAMIFPTILLAVFLAVKTRSSTQVFLPNMAIVFWIAANSIWMSDEFFDLKIRFICPVFFGAGLMCIIWWLIRYFPAESKQAKA